MTALKLTPEQVGAFEFPFVVELLEYWLEYPPEHLLLRAMAHYEGKSKKGRSNWRSRRAQEMDDEQYVPDLPEKSERSDLSIPREASDAFGGTRHADCAPGHIQQAIERFKKHKHLDIPKPE